MLKTALDQKTNRSLLGILNYYRLLIAIIILIYSLPNNFYTSGSFLTASITYPVLISTFYIFTSFTIIFIQPQKKNSATFTLLTLSIDTIAIIAVTHTLGGIHTGIPSLLLATVAFGNIFFNGAPGYFIASVSAICILFSVFLNTLTDPTYIKYYFPASVFSSIFFIESYILQILVKNLSTAKKQTQEKEKEIIQIEQLNTLIVNRMQTGVIIFNKSLEIISINGSAHELSNNLLKNKKTLVGTNFEEPASQFITENKRAVTLAAQGKHSEISITFSAPEKENTFVAFLTNLSEIKQKAQLIKLSSLGHLSASIAHEIRNPLTAIHQANQLLAESENLDTADRHLLSIIENNTLRINNIVEDTSSISKRQAAKPEMVALCDFITQLLKEIQDTGKFPDIHSQLNINKDITVQFDINHLNQILTNLIENALAFSFEKTKIASISILANINEDGFPYMQIFDDGLGINEIDRQHIFEPFFSRRKGGSGLGLYICKDLCELNHAIIEYHQESEHKHYFQVTFAHSEKKLTNL